MRPITKVFLLLVAAFLVYLLWPRTPDFNGFDPAALAKLKVQEWAADRDGKSLGSLLARYKVYTSQYHFSPVAAFQMAMSHGSAQDEIKRLQAQGLDAAEDARVLSQMTEKYAIMKRQVQKDFDPGAQAREEIAWCTLVLQGAPADQVAAPIQRLLAADYGGNPEDFLDVAANLAQAQMLIFGPNPPADGGDAKAEAEQFAREAYSLLKEIAATPAPATASTGG